MSRRNRRGSARRRARCRRPSRRSPRSPSRPAARDPRPRPASVVRRGRQPRPRSATCGLSETTTSQKAAARSWPARRAMNASSMATVMSSDSAPWRKVTSSGGMASSATIISTRSAGRQPFATWVSSRQPSQTSRPNWMALQSRIAREERQERQGHEREDEVRRVVEGIEPGHERQPAEQPPLDLDLGRHVIEVVAATIEDDRPAGHERRVVRRLGRVVDDQREPQSPRYDREDDQTPAMTTRRSATADSLSRPIR